MSLGIRKISSTYSQNNPKTKKIILIVVADMSRASDSPPQIPKKIRLLFDFEMFCNIMNANFHVVSYA